MCRRCCNAVAHDTSHRAKTRSVIIRRDVIRHVASGRVRHHVLTRSVITSCRVASRQNRSRAFSEIGEIDTYLSSMMIIYILNFSDRRGFGGRPRHDGAHSYYIKHIFASPITSFGNLSGNREVSRQTLPRTVREASPRNVALRKNRAPDLTWPRIPRPEQPSARAKFRTFNIRDI